MEIKEITNIPLELRTTLQKAIQAIDKNNAEYAVNLLQSVLAKEPGFIQARNKLRIAEKIMQSNFNMFKKVIGTIKVKKIVKTAQFDFIRGRYSDAMLKIEEALAVNVKDWKALSLLADCAVALKIDFIVTETYEFAYSVYPDNKEIIKTLANHYRKLSRGKDELRLRQKLVEMYPENLEYKQELRSAGAMATMERGGDQKIDSFMEKLKDKKDTAILEQQDRQIHDIDDVKDLLEELKGKLKANPDSISIIHDLAWTYYKGNLHEQAFEYFKMLELKQEHFDLASNKALEAIILSLSKNKVRKIEQELKQTNDIHKKELLSKEIVSVNSSDMEIRKVYAKKRAEIYPNDLELKYELAVIFWELSEFDLAIEQFQLAQKHPKFHFSANVYLGKCFLKKEHIELAIDQLRKVIKMESNNDKELLEAIYYLGISFEKINDNVNAKECFKKIYSINSKYRDISEKIKKYFAQK